MKKMISIAVVAMAMVLGMSSMAYAETKALEKAVNVNGTTYNAGTQGVVSNGHTFSTNITVNGTTYAPGTQFQVITTAAGEVVPVAATSNVVIVTSGAAATTAAAGSMTVVAGTAAVFTALVAIATDKNNTPASASVSGT